MWATNLNSLAADAIDPVSGSSCVSSSATRDLRPRFGGIANFYLWQYKEVTRVSMVKHLVSNLLLGGWQFTSAWCHSLFARNTERQIRAWLFKATGLHSFPRWHCPTDQSKLTLLVTVLGTSWAQYWGSAIHSSVFHNQSSLQSFCNTGSHHRCLIVVGTLTSILCVAIDATFSFSALLQSKETYMLYLNLYSMEF